MKKLKLKKGYLKGGLTDAGAHGTATVKGQDGQAEKAVAKAPLTADEQALLDAKNAKIAAGITGGVALTAQAVSNKNTSIGESALQMGATGAATGAAIGGPVGAAVGAGAGALIGTTSAVINQKKAAKERAQKSAAANKFIGNILTDQKQASSAYSTEDSKFNQFTGVNSFVTPDEFIGIQNGMAKGGEIKGKGGPKDDAIDAKVKAGSFVVPAENKPVAKAIGVNMLGHSPNQKAKLKQGGGADVKLSNDEYLFTPKEKNKLLNKGVDLNQLAPNSDSPIAGRAIVNKGKKMGGEVVQGRAIVNGYKGGGETTDEEPTLEEIKAKMKRDSKNVPAWRREYSKGVADTFTTDPDKAALMQYNAIRAKASKSANPKKALADIKKMLTYDEVAARNKSNKAAADAQKKYADNEAKKRLQFPEKKKENTAPYYNKSTDTSPQDAYLEKLTKSTGIPLVTADGKPTGQTAAASTTAPVTTPTTTTKTPTATKGTGATKKSTTVPTTPTIGTAATGYNAMPVSLMPPLVAPPSPEPQKRIIATPTQIAAIDAKNKAELAPAPGQFAKTVDLLGGPASIAAMGQIGIGLINNLGNDRPVDTMPGELSIRLTDAIQDEAKLDQQATFGLEQKQKNKVLNDIENNRVQALNAVTSTTGGDGTAMTAIRGAAVDKNNAQIELAAKDEMLKNQKLGVAVAAGARADQLATTKAEYKRKIFEDSFNAFQQNQEANGQLINAGITNFVGNLGQRKLVKDLAAMKEKNSININLGAQ